MIPRVDGRGGRGGATEPPRRVAGWREIVSLPEWGIDRIEAKVDTGARTSSLHVENVGDLPHGRVAFDVVLSRRGTRRIRVVARRVRISRVRASSGRRKSRDVVTTLLRIGPVERRIELNLHGRGRMKYRMLLGRTALGPDILGDSSRQHILGDRPRRRRKR